jgi:asparagine synthase (glutamine-hydrolysing)
MCGICGILYQDKNKKVDEQLLTQVRDSMVHRGPDDCGIYISENIGIGSRRLSILDLSERGHMPMSTSDGRYWIVHNGEVYNYRELRKGLELKGYTFHSTSDTEVLLKLYQDQGPNMMSQLNGIFAFAIWDTLEKKLFISRDHLGVKPLYFANCAGAFYFASEIKALLEAGVPATFDHNNWEELLIFRFVGGENTVFNGISRLLPGHWLMWQDGASRIKRYWNLGQKIEEARNSVPENPYEWYKESFDKVINSQRISDVPVGVLLSGGLDSGSTAAALAMQSDAGVHAFNVRFHEDGYDEGLLAQSVANKWNLQYHDLFVTPEDMVNQLPRAMWLNDEPFVHSSYVHIWAISEYAKPHVTVLLSGEGGDETLGGYVRYQPLRYSALVKLGMQALPHFFDSHNMRGRGRKFSRFLALRSIDQYVLYNACNTLPADLLDIGLHPNYKYEYRWNILEEAKKIYPGEPIRQTMYLDHFTYIPSLLDRNDKMTMGASIECRVPFLDYQLVEFLSALPSKVMFNGIQNKTILRKSIGYRLTKEVLHHKKWGFGIPWIQYLRQIPEFRAVIMQIPDLEPVRNGPFNREKIRTICNEFLQMSPHYEALVLELFMITAWYQVYFNKLNRF